MKSVLIANRGEIAMRIIRTCKEEGIRSIVAFSEADRFSPAVKFADDSICLGGAPAAESYLATDKIIAAAQETGADAIHPGCGFLSENPEFAVAVAKAGLIFIGPTPSVMADLGDKRRARELAQEAGIPVVPGLLINEGSPPSRRDLEKIGLPVVVKAAHGGGGRGMRVVEKYEQITDAIDQAQRESQSAFGRSDVFIERFILRSRHVEVQIMGDAHGTILDFGTRDCTVQRRHQKLIEEAPAPFLPENLTLQIREAARKLGAFVGYLGAGTAEFLVDPVTHDFYFLEMNTRLQVEHPVTEMITNLDLVSLQFRVAQGLPIGLSQQDVHFSGHAIEFRVNAEDPADSFRPHTGTISQLNLAQGMQVRNDFGVVNGSEVTPFYDSMIGKIIVFGNSRSDAIARMLRSAQEFSINGIPTTVNFDVLVLQHDAFIKGNHWTTMVDEGHIDISSLQQWSVPEIVSSPHVEQQSVDMVQIDTSTGPILLLVPTSDQPHSLGHESGNQFLGLSLGDTDRQLAPIGPIAPMDGTLIRYVVEAGMVITAETTIALMESMKMETAILAGVAGVVSELLETPGKSIKRGTLLARINP